VKQLFIISFLLGFCLNQPYVAKTLVHCHNKLVSKVNNDITDNTPADEEEDSEEKNSEKEIEYFVVSADTDAFSKLVLIQLKHNISSINLLCSLPFKQKDIKPPRFA